MKKTILTTLTFIFLLTGVILTAYASEGAEHHAQGIDNKFIFSVINFIILSVALVYFLRKPSKEFFANRSQQTKLDIEKSEKARQDTYKHFQQIEAKLKNIDVEGRIFINSVKEQAEIEKKHIIAQAIETAQKIKSDAQRIAGQELIKAKRELQAETVELAAKLAVQKIKQQITSEDQVRLGNEFVTHMKKAGVL